MNGRDDLERRNDAVYAEHKAALLRGERRVLSGTRDGVLRSSAADADEVDELGLLPGRGHAQVTTWWGMAFLAALMAGLAALSLVILLVPVAQGGAPYWGALCLTAFGVGGCWYLSGLARAEFRARRVREGRGGAPS